MICGLWFVVCGLWLAVCGLVLCGLVLCGVCCVVCTCPQNHSTAEPHKIAEAQNHSTKTHTTRSHNYTFCGSFALSVVALLQFCGSVVPCCGLWSVVCGLWYVVCHEPQTTNDKPPTTCHRSLVTEHRPQSHSTTEVEKRRTTQPNSTQLQTYKTTARKPQATEPQKHRTAEQQERRTTEPKSKKPQKDIRASQQQRPQSQCFLCFCGYVLRFVVCGLLFCNRRATNHVTTQPAPQNGPPTERYTPHNNIITNHRTTKLLPLVVDDRTTEPPHHKIAAPRIQKAQTTNHRPKPQTQTTDTNHCKQHNTPTTNHYKPQTTNHRPQTPDHRPHTTDHKPRTTDHTTQTTNNKQQTTTNQVL